MNFMGFKNYGDMDTKHSVCASSYWKRVFELQLGMGVFSHFFYVRCGDLLKSFLDYSTPAQLLESTLRGSFEYS